jgi:ornithine carbamoyltransferase
MTATSALISSRHAGSLLKELDLTKEQFLALLDRAAQLKEDKHSGAERPLLRGKNIALVFEKASTRTRCAFEVAAHDQGAHVTYLGPEGSHLGREESIPDTARVLGRMFDGIEFRGLDQDTVEQLVDYASVPVRNVLTDQWHATQMLADMLTMREHQSGPLDQISYCYVGDARSNVGESLLITGALLGMDVRIATPPDLRPPQEVLDQAQALDATSGARILLTDDPLAGVVGADYLYTDGWVSMGESEATWDKRVPELRPYQVTEQLLDATGNADTKFLHCLPALHDRSTRLGQRLYDRYGLDGAEVTNAVFESAQSLVLDQAENRLHTIKAVLVAALAP